MSASDRYDIAEDSLKSFTRSKVRTKILLCLKDGAKGTGDLEKEMGIRNTTILHAIKEMNDSDLVTRADKGYGLTNLGKMQATMLDDMIDFVLVLEKYSDFWLTHDISGIPEGLLGRIGMLSQSEIIEADPSELLKTVEYFIGELKKSRYVRGVSPIILPGYAEVIAHCVKNGAEVELIVTSDILKIIFRDHGDLVNDLLKHNNFRLYEVREDVTVAFTVTDKLLDLGLYRLDGTYDLSCDLICVGESAVDWGGVLFDYYRNKSVSVT